MTTSPIIVPVFRAFDTSGNPLAFGKVYTYAAGTNTLKTTYTDFGGGTGNTNPVVLDASGQAPIWLDGNYKINLLDANNVQQANYPVDNVFSISSGGATEYALTTGTANNYVLAPSPAIVIYQAGQAFNININISNTGPSTINISALGTKSIVTNLGYPLAGGELLAGGVYRIVYDGTNFQLLNPTPPIQISMGITPVAPWGTLPMNGTVTVAKTSGATYNNAIYARVYAYLWDNYANGVAPVSTGRGANAAADFAANKNITIPDHADYIMLGVSAAGLVTTAGATVGASTVVSTGSVSGTISINGVTLSQANLPSTVTITQSSSGDVDNGAGGNSKFAGADSGANTRSVSIGLGSGTAFTPTGSMSASYTGNATSVVQKSRGIYFYISY